MRACTTFSVWTQFMMATVRSVDFREECHLSHACVLQSNMRGIQWHPRECKFMSKNAHRTKALLPPPDEPLAIRVAATAVLLAAPNKRPVLMSDVIDVKRIVKKDQQPISARRHQGGEHWESSATDQCVTSSRWQALRIISNRTVLAATHPGGA